METYSSLIAGIAQRTILNTTDEFRSLAENTPELMNRLAASIGVTRGELKKMSSDGKLTSEVMAKAFKDMAAGVDADFQKVPKTVARGLNVVSNEIAMAIDKFNQLRPATKNPTTGEMEEAVTITSEIYNLLTNNVVPVVREFDTIVSVLAAALVGKLSVGLLNVASSMRQSNVAFLDGKKAIVEHTKELQTNAMVNQMAAQNAATASNRRLVDANNAVFAAQQQVVAMEKVAETGKNSYRVQRDLEKAHISLLNAQNRVTAAEIAKTEATRAAEKATNATQVAIANHTRASEALAKAKTVAATALRGFMGVLNALGGPVFIAISLITALALNWDRLTDKMVRAKEAANDSANAIRDALALGGRAGLEKAIGQEALDKKALDEAQKRVKSLESASAKGVTPPQYAAGVGINRNPRELETAKQELEVREKAWRDSQAARIDLQEQVTAASNKSNRVVQDGLKAQSTANEQMEQSNAIRQRGIELIDKLGKTRDAVERNARAEAEAALAKEIAEKGAIDIAKQKEFIDTKVNDALEKFDKSQERAAKSANKLTKEQKEQIKAANKYADVIKELTFLNEQLERSEYMEAEAKFVKTYTDKLADKETKANIESVKQLAEATYYSTRLKEVEEAHREREKKDLKDLTSLTGDWAEKNVEMLKKQEESLKQYQLQAQAAFDTVGMSEYEKALYELAVAQQTLNEANKLEGFYEREDKIPKAQEGLDSAKARADTIRAGMAGGFNQRLGNVGKSESLTKMEEELKAEQEMFKAFEAQMKVVQGENYAQKEAAEEEHQRKMAEIKKKYQLTTADAVLSNMKAMMSAVESIDTKDKARQKKLFQFKKALALAEIAINTYKEASTKGTWWEKAAVYAVGAVTAAAVASQKFPEDNSGSGVNSNAGIPQNIPVTPSSATASTPTTAASGGNTVIVNRTTGTVTNTREQTLSNGDRMIILEETEKRIAASMSDPNSRLSRQMQRNLQVQRNR